ncbi:hypothetical protein [Candidatus Formimonas warabiya]|uniref:hypothetical protein n=1 Tax=Formimonas warabiya TaxID=1761012 RepID=UPI001BE46853|nr:hypothetical protein [Candidatus Formimonas warabiya]
MVLKNISNEELAILATIFAISISKDVAPDDVSILGDFFTIVGDVLSLLGEER